MKTAKVIYKNGDTQLFSKYMHISLLLDLKKAITTIDHNILLHELERHGFRGITLMCKITCGVPQGPILGPKLFVSINDICSVSNVFTYVLFADDTTLHCSGEHVNILLKKAEQELHKWKTWFDLNNLSLNRDKTKYVVFLKKPYLQN